MTLTNEVKKRSQIEEFSENQYGFSKHVHQDMQHTTKLGQKRDNFLKNKAIFEAYSDGSS
jgi:hypothetical protein